MKINLLLLLLSLPCTGVTQIPLKSGESWSYKNTLPFKGLSFGLVNCCDLARVRLDFLTNSFGADDVLRCEMFEDTPSGIPFARQDFSGPAASAELEAAAHWVDLQGAVRLTMISGDAALANISLTYLVAIGDGAIFNFSTNVTLVPLLSVSPLPNGRIALTWPTNAYEFVLEYSDSLRPDSWMRFPGGVAEDQRRFRAEDLILSGRYYRLYRP
jgi:hypothetical protein